MRSSGSPKRWTTVASSRFTVGMTLMARIGSLSAAAKSSGCSVMRRVVLSMCLALSARSRIAEIAVSGASTVTIIRASTKPSGACA